MMKSLILATILVFILQPEVKCQIIVADNGTGHFIDIQPAIDSASPGSTILVKDGYYSERIVLKDSIFLIGEGQPIINAWDTGTVVTLGNYCTIKGFIVLGSGSEVGTVDCGILARNVKGCNIIGNYIFENGHYGVILDNAEANIYYNTITINDILGVYISNNSTYNIAFNDITKHPYSGIAVETNTAGKVYNNNFVDNTSGVSYADETGEPLDMEIWNNIFCGNENALYSSGQFLHKVSHNCFFKNYHNWYDWSIQKGLGLPPTNFEKNPRFKDKEINHFDVENRSLLFAYGRDSTFVGSVPIRRRADWIADAVFSDSNAKYTIWLNGTAINYTAGNIQAKIKCLLSSNDGINYKLEGQYDNITLFGHFLLEGKLVSRENGSLLITFKNGCCWLGNDNSGYPYGTKMPHSVSLSIASGSIAGTYTCGVVTPLSMTEQYGSYNFPIQEGCREIESLLGEGIEHLLGYSNQ